MEFELDYADFLDEALMESEGGDLLKRVWEKNERLKNEGRPGEVEWWILKPGMSDQATGIRVFESEDSLRRIFESWEDEAQNEEEEEDEEVDDEDAESTPYEGDIADDEDSEDSDYQYDSDSSSSSDSDEEGDNYDQDPDSDEGIGNVISELEDLEADNRIEMDSSLSHHLAHTNPSQSNPPRPRSPSNKDTNIPASSLRHFLCQPYISPLLFPRSPTSSSPQLCLLTNRKFHIRTYVLALGALKVYVYERMLALFAAKSYVSPSDAMKAGRDPNDPEELGDRGMSNTCLQQTQARDGSGEAGARMVEDNSVRQLSSLPSGVPTRSGNPWSPTSSVAQIKTLTASLFRAAAAQPTNFQPLPNAFEVFGIDWLVDEKGETWLLEVNAFPDFGMTGENLGEKVVGGLWKGVLGVLGCVWLGMVGVSERWGEEYGEEKREKERKLVDGEEAKGGEEEAVYVGWGMWRVLDLDLGRR